MLRTCVWIIAIVMVFAPWLQAADIPSPIGIHTEFVNGNGCTCIGGTVAVLVDISDCDLKGLHAAGTVS